VKLLSKEMQILWHARLGHVGFEPVRRAAPTGAITGIDLTAHTKSCNCHTCLLQKASRRPFMGSLVKRASLIGDVIHTDLAGPMPPTISGYKYVQSFINGRTRLKYIYLLKKKSDAGGTLRDFIFKFEREHDCLVKAVHADNAAEFIGGDFNSCLREQGIKFTSSAPYSPELNGLAENFNKVLFARVRCLLDHAKMGQVMWGEAAHHAVHLLNITPSRSLGNITPHEAAYGDVRRCQQASCVWLCSICDAPASQEARKQGCARYQLGTYWLWKTSSTTSGTRVKIFIATSVKFDEEVFDNAADAAKEVIGISNAADGDDIISNAKPLLDSDDGDEDEDASVANPKAVPQIASVNTQDIPNQDDDVQGQEVDATRAHGF
jgi:GAG-pre-integrase domain